MELINCLDGLAVRYRSQLDEHENAILEVHGEIIVAGVSESRVTTVGTFSERETRLDLGSVMLIPDGNRLSACLKPMADDYGKRLNMV